MGAFGRHPVLGTGSGGFAVEWLRERTIDESVRDVHSLYLETATELGLVGLALLAVFLAGAGGVAAQRALGGRRRRRARRVRAARRARLGLGDARRDPAGDRPAGLAGGQRAKR